MRMKTVTKVCGAILLTGMMILSPCRAYAGEEGNPAETVSEEMGQVANGYYAIASAMDSSKMIHVAEGSQEEDASVEIWDDSELYNEIYYIEMQQDGFYKIINAVSGKSLQVRDASGESGVELQQKTYDADEGQKWSIYATEDGYYTIQSALGTVIDCAGGNTENGNRILMCAENGGMNQKWALYRDGVKGREGIRNGVYAIASDMDLSKQLCILNGSEEENTPVVIWDNQQYENQSFYIELQSDGNYKVISAVSGKSLSVKDGSSESGAMLEMKSYDGTQAQQWRIEETEDGRYFIQSALSTYLDCAEANTENGNQILLCELNGNSNQKWALLPQGMILGDIAKAEGSGEEAPQEANAQPVPAAVESGLYQITSAMDSNKALHIVNDSGEEGAALEIRDNENSGFQTFFIGDNGDGTYRISCDAAGGLSLDVKDASPESGAILQMRSYDATAGQSWIIEPSEDGMHYCIKSVLGTSLDCYGASSENGTSVTMFEATGSINQLWNLQRVG